MKKKTGILESTRRMLGLVSQSEQIGTDTATELVAQREQLNKIANNCDSIDNNLIDAQQNINKLKSIFGGVKNYFQRPTSSFLTKSASQPQFNNTHNSSSPKPSGKNISGQQIVKRDETDTYFGKPRSQMDDLEREADDTLRDVHMGVARLKNLAMDLNHELEGQKPIIEGLTGKVDKLDRRVNQQNKQMKDILLR